MAPPRLFTQFQILIIIITFIIIKPNSFLFVLADKEITSHFAMICHPRNRSVNARTSFPLPPRTIIIIIINLGLELGLEKLVHNPKNFLSFLFICFAISVPANYFCPAFLRPIPLYGHTYSYGLDGGSSTYW